MEMTTPVITSPTAGSGGQEVMDMTTPVMTAPASTSTGTGQFTMQFIMPKQVRTTVCQAGGEKVTVT